MQYESVRMPELKALARDRGLRNYSQMRKAELVALLQNNPLPSQSRASASPTPCTRSSLPPPQRHAAYVTFKFDDNGVAGFTAFLMMGPLGPGSCRGPMEMGGKLLMKDTWLCPGKWLPGMAKLWGCTPPSGAKPVAPDPAGP